MSRKGNCWDNSVVESFIGTWKQEHVFFCDYATREEARRSVLEYIEGWYNAHRLHSTLDYMSSVEFAQSLLASCSFVSTLFGFVPILFSEGGGYLR